MSSAAFTQWRNRYTELNEAVIQVSWTLSWLLPVSFVTGNDDSYVRQYLFIPAQTLYFFVLAQLV
jgi:hypothetical protein